MGELLSNSEGEKGGDCSMVKKGYKSTCEEGKRGERGLDIYIYSEEEGKIMEQDGELQRLGDMQHQGRF
jgi:hypothetical protein